MRRVWKVVVAMRKASETTRHMRNKIPGKKRVDAYIKIVVPAFKKYDDWCRKELEKI